MSGLAQSARQRRIDAQCQPARTALHIPTNHQYRIVLEIPGADVELEDTERRSLSVTWDAWTNHEIWRYI